MFGHVAILMSSMVTYFNIRFDTNGKFGLRRKINDNRNIKLPDLFLLTLCF